MQSISIQGGRRAKITYRTFRKKSSAMNRKQALIDSNTRSKQASEHEQTIKTSSQGTEGSKKGKDERLEPGCESKSRDWRNVAGAKFKFCKPKF